MPRRLHLLAVLPLALLAIGCVSKKEADQLRADLAACEEEKLIAEASVIAWEQRFDRETRRWQEMEATVTEAVPQALAEFHQERDRILELVPEQVQGEVESYLEDYFSAVMKGFELLKDDNREIRLRLDATYDALKVVGQDTRAIGTAIDGAMAEERAERERERDEIDLRLGDLRAQLAGVVDRVVAFDQERINCKDCAERLRLNRKERETILGFHAELLNGLAEVQAATGQ